MSHEIRVPRREALLDDRQRVLDLSLIEFEDAGDDGRGAAVSRAFPLA